MSEPTKRHCGSHREEEVSVDANFYFYFNEQNQAQPLAQQLRDEGFEVTVGPAASGDTWLLLANKDVSDSELDELEERFESELGAKYDGFDRATE